MNLSPSPPLRLQSRTYRPCFLSRKTRISTDVMRASSAGLLPARHVLSTTRMMMEEKAISLQGAVPKNISKFALDEFDLIVNMSGHALPKTTAPVVKVLVRDPNGKDETVHRHVRDRVEAIVEDLVHMLRLARLEQFGLRKESALRSMAAEAC